MKFINIIENFLNLHKIWLDILTLIGAFVFGFWQILINKRLTKLQDYVAISAVPDSRTNKINLINVGKINLYLFGFDLPKKKERFKKPRLISAGTGDTSYYWIDPPMDLDIEKEFEITLCLEDEFRKKWISEIGGRANKITEVKNNKKIEYLQIIVWSYKTYKKKWTFQ